MQTRLSVKLLTLVSFIVMILTNALAEILPFNNITIVEISDSYPNLFAPAPITFSIWGVIYFFLLIYVLYVMGLFRSGRPTRPAFLEKTAVLFSISSLANAAWMVAWHYRQIVLSMILMVIILIALASIYRSLDPTQLTRRERLCMRLPFSIYLGWISIATIANATALFVSFGFDGGTFASVWMDIILIVGLAIGLMTIIKGRDIAYGLVFIWAYIGILIKHTSSTGFNNAYPFVIAVVWVCLVALAVVICYLAFQKIRARR